MGQKSELVKVQGHQKEGYFILNSGTESEAKTLKGQLKPDGIFPSIIMEDLWPRWVRGVVQKPV